MINIKKIFRIVGGDAPYTIFPNTSAEVEITRGADNLVTLDLTYATEEDINPQDSVTVIDKSGCISSSLLQIVNVCDNFVVSQIQKTGGSNSPEAGFGEQSVFTIEANQPTAITWTLDNPEIYTTETKNNTITLTQVQSGISQTKLKGNVTNSNNCGKQREFSLFPCRTLTGSRVVNLTYNPITQLYGKFGVEMIASTNCSGAVIDWSTAIINFPSNITAVQRPGQPYLDITSTAPINNVGVAFSVSNSQGLRSNISSIVASVELPTIGGPPVGIDPIFIGVDDNNITTPLTGLFPPGVVGTGVSPSYTTANSAIVTNNTLTTNTLGLPVTTVGVITNTGIVVLTFIREIGDYVAQAEEINVFCNPVIKNLTTYSDVTSANNIVSGSATLVNNTLTLTQAGQEVIVNVTNADGQNSNKTFYVCGSCGTNSTSTTCNLTINLFDALNGNPNPNGTWTSVTGGPLPSTYNGDVTLTNTGLYGYTYSSPNNVGDYSCTDGTTFVLQINKTLSGFISNNSCVASSLLSPITGAGQITITREISNLCAIETTYSGNEGNLNPYAYDQWFRYTSNTSANTRVTFTLTGTGATPINEVALQIWNTCSVPLNTTNTSTLSTYTAVTQTGSTNPNPDQAAPQGIFESRDYFIQVLSNNIGNYNLNINQTII